MSTQQTTSQQPTPEPERKPVQDQSGGASALPFAAVCSALDPLSRAYEVLCREGITTEDLGEALKALELGNLGNAATALAPEQISALARAIREIFKNLDLRENLAEAELIKAYTIQLSCMESTEFSGELSELTNLHTIALYIPEGESYADIRDRFQKLIKSVAELSSEDTIYDYVKNELTRAFSQSPKTIAAGCLNEDRNQLRDSPRLVRFRELMSCVFDIDKAPKLKLITLMLVAVWAEKTEDISLPRIPIGSSFSPAFNSGEVEPNNQPSNAQIQQFELAKFCYRLLNDLFSKVEEKDLKDQLLRFLPTVAEKDNHQPPLVTARFAYEAVEVALKRLPATQSLEILAQASVRLSEIKREASKSYKETRTTEPSEDTEVRYSDLGPKLNSLIIVFVRKKLEEDPTLSDDLGICSTALTIPLYSKDATSRFEARELIKKLLMSNQDQDTQLAILSDSRVISPELPWFRAHTVAQEVFTFLHQIIDLLEKRKDVLVEMIDIALSPASYDSSLYSSLADKKKSKNQSKDRLIQALRDINRSVSREGQKESGPLDQRSLEICHAVASKFLEKVNATKHDHNSGKDTPIRLKDFVWINILTGFAKRLLDVASANSEQPWPADLDLEKWPKFQELKDWVDSRAKK